jgi:hypothetical protein
MEISKSNTNYPQKTNQSLNPLSFAMKDRKKISSAGGNENKFLDNVFGKPSKQPTKKEAERDRKVEALLEAYK